MDRCKHCDRDDDLIGPFEMDGIVKGEYHPRGLWWIFCRRCASHTHVEAPK